MGTFWAQLLMHHMRMCFDEIPIFIPSTWNKHPFLCVCGVGCDINITKTRLYNFDPLKSHFYIVKLGFTGVYIIFLISAQKHRLWVLVRTASPSFEQKYEKYQNFYLKIFTFLVVKFSIYLNRRVFVMNFTEVRSTFFGFVICWLISYLSGPSCSKHR